jgi:hypothetical protein
MGHGVDGNRAAIALGHGHKFQILTRAHVYPRVAEVTLRPLARWAQRETSGSWTGFFRCLNLWPSDPSGHNIWDKIVSNLVGDRCQKTACGSISAPGDSNDD